MTELNDHDLLAEFTRNESEAAFAELVTRHINLVYSSALRFTGNAHHTEEITQAVFIILARKAGKLSPRVVLSGWLYQTARLTAANFVKGEIRRQRREQEAYMQSTLNETDSAAAWKQIAPLLDEAMEHLCEADRDALVLRFFENKTTAEVGTALKLSEAAAHKRMSRALEKLRLIFNKRAVTLSATIIAGAVTANSVQAAPAGLAVTISATSAKGASVTATVSTLVKGTLKIMTYAKLKLAIGISTSVLLASGATIVILAQNNGGDEESASQAMAQKIAKKSQDTYAALTSYSDDGIVDAESGSQTATTTFNTKLRRPNLYRIEWSQETQYVTNTGAVWSAGNGNFLLSIHGQKNVRPDEFQDMQSALDTAKGISGQASSTIPETFFNQNWGGVLKTPASGRPPLARLDDDTIDGIDCYVLSSSMDPANLPNQGNLPKNMGRIGKTTTKFWIGKRDYFIHQTQTVMVGASINLPVMSNSQIKRMLKKPVTPEEIAAVRKMDDAVAASMTRPQMTDEKIKTELEKQNKPTMPEDITAERNRLDAYAASITLPQMTDEKITAMIKAQEAAPEAVASMKKTLASIDKQTQGMMPSGRFVLTQTHADIVVNQNLTVADFAR